MSSERVSGTVLGHRGRNRTIMRPSQIGAGKPSTIRDKQRNGSQLGAYYYTREKYTEAMNCQETRKKILLHMDRELATGNAADLEAHIAGCPQCAREYRLLSLPRRIGRVLPVLEPSPFFYRRLRAQLEAESQGVSLWQILLGLSRPVVPALGAITLVLLSVFAYELIQVERVAAYQAYDQIFMSSDRPRRMVIADVGEITDESVLQALTESVAAHSAGSPAEAGPSK